MIKLLRGKIEGRTYLEIDEELLTDISGIEVQAGGESYVISFSKVPSEEPGIIEPAGKPKAKAKATKAKRTHRKRFSAVLEKHAEELGTKVELAKKIGVDVSMVHKYCKGVQPQGRTLKKINKALGTNYTLEQFIW